jgi:hypothetical protein
MCTVGIVDDSNSNLNLESQLIQHVFLSNPHQSGNKSSDFRALFFLKRNPESTERRTLCASSLSITRVVGERGSPIGRSTSVHGPIKLTPSSPTQILPRVLASSRLWPSPPDRPSPPRRPRTTPPDRFPIWSIGTWPSNHYL